MYARLTPRLLVLLAVLCGSSAYGQTPVTVRAIDPSTFSTVMFGDATNSAIRVVQTLGTQVATSFWTIRLSDGTNYLTPGTDYTHDAALTIATTTGPVGMGRASNAAPTAVSADNDAVAGWFDTRGTAVQAIAATTAAGIAATECVVLSTASTNATNCKNAAGSWYGYDLINTTTTIYYLRLYNTSAAPTCSSATGFIRASPIPPAGAAGQAGGAIRQFVIPVAYTTGISFCLTGGSTSTDNTNAAAGVFGSLLVK